MITKYPRNDPRFRRLNQALHRVILLRETGPKSAAWQRARTETVWRLHTLMDACQTEPYNDLSPPTDTK